MRRDRQSIIRKRGEGMTREERELSIEYLEKIKKDYIEGNAYERHPLPEYYAIENAIKALEQKPKWIPVTEKLPEEKTAVLLSCDDMYLAKLNPCIGWISGNNWYTFSARGSYLVKYPIAWMPLPKPYKGGQEDDSN